MQTQKQISEFKTEVPVEIPSIDQLASSPSVALDIGAKLPAIQRAQIAKFCYQRVHMRELGLRLANMCDRHTLRLVFGSGVDAIYKQSRQVEKTLSELSSRRHGGNITLVSLATRVEE